MSKLSAGILLYRLKATDIEVFLVHPGGPFWAKKDTGAWSIPKGEYVQGEDPLCAAQREFLEETVLSVDGNFQLLSFLKQSSGKIIRAWALQGDCDTAIQSNTFTTEWPPHCGKIAEFPEVD